MITNNAVINTAGNGLWSNVATAVTLEGFSVPYINEEQDFGELCVHFDTTTWNVEKDGLIYTDSQFLNEVEYLLTNLGYDMSDVSYSEQGMQGDDYVSMDVGPAFLVSHRALHPTEYAGVQ